MTKDQLHYILDAYGVSRYHTAKMIHDQQVGDHSAKVAMITIYLTDSERLVLAALLHDIAELDVGDTPATTKWVYPGLAEALGDAETVALATRGILLPELSPEDQKILKAADMLELILHAWEETKMGNRNAYGLIDRGIRYLNKLNLPREVKGRIDQLLREVPYGC